MSKGQKTVLVRRTVPPDHVTVRRRRATRLFFRAQAARGDAPEQAARANVAAYAALLDLPLPLTEVEILLKSFVAMNTGE